MRPYNRILHTLKENVDSHLKELQEYMLHPTREWREPFELRPYSDLSIDKHVLRFETLSHRFMMCARFCPTLGCAIVLTFEEQHKVSNNRTYYTYIPELNFTICQESAIEFAKARDYNVNQKQHFEKHLSKNYAMRLEDVIIAREKKLRASLMAQEKMQETT